MNAKGWGTLRLGLGGEEPGAEILRWESPALPETPLPQDDYGDGIVVARLKSCPSRDQRVGGTLIHSDRVEHKVPPLRFASVGMTELFRYVETAKVFSARWKSLWRCRVPPLHRTQRWGTPRFGLGGKGPGAEILRWESPALPETPLPQDDHGDGIVVARLKSCPSQDRRVGGTLIRERSCGRQGPSTALRFGRDDRIVLLSGDGGVFFAR